MADQVLRISLTSFLISWLYQIAYMFPLFFLSLSLPLHFPLPSVHPVPSFFTFVSVFCDNVRLEHIQVCYLSITVLLNLILGGTAKHPDHPSERTFSPANVINVLLIRINYFHLPSFPAPRNHVTLKKTRRQSPCWTQLCGFGLWEFPSLFSCWTILFMCPGWGLFSSQSVMIFFSEIK